MLHNNSWTHNFVEKHVFYLDQTHDEEEEEENYKLPIDDGLVTLKRFYCAHSERNYYIPDNIKAFLAISNLLDQY